MAAKKGYVWKLGEIMVQQGWIQWPQLEEALAIQRKTGFSMGDIMIKRGFVGQKEGSILYLGEILVRNGWITWEALEKALAIQREDGRILGDILLHNKFVTKENLFNALALQYNIPYVKLKDFTPQNEAIQLVAKRLVYEYQFLPLLKKEQVFVLAVSNPVQTLPEEELRNALEPECRFHFVLAYPEDIEDALKRYYPD